MGALGQVAEGGEDGRRQRRAREVGLRQPLVGPQQVGDLGEAAYDFLDFLAATGQAYWQVLPLSPTGYGDSPYQGLSAFAGHSAGAAHVCDHLHLDLSETLIPYRRSPLHWSPAHLRDALRRAFHRLVSAARGQMQCTYHTVHPTPVVQSADAAAGTDHTQQTGRT